MAASPKLVVIALGFLLGLSVGRAEDWTTTDGKTYKNVKVVKVEDDAVTILDEDGGARVPLSTLSPDLQKKFNYDPAKAAIAAKQYQDEQEALDRAADEAANKAAGQGPDAATDPLSTQLEAGKIRLIGKLLSKVAGGYILGTISAADGYTVQLDQSRPDYQYVNALAPAGTLFLQTSDTGKIEGAIIDVDAYPLGAYTTISGQTIPSFTTDHASALAYLKLKQSK